MYLIFKSTKCKNLAAYLAMEFLNLLFTVLKIMFLKTHLFIQSTLKFNVPATASTY